MDTQRRRVLASIGGCAALFASTWPGQSIAANTPSTGGSFSGNLGAPGTFSQGDLGQFPALTVDFKAPDGSARKYTGALLRDVLAATKPLETDHDALRQSYLVAKGTDGYFALFTWAELLISP